MAATAYLNLTLLQATDVVLTDVAAISTNFSTIDAHCLASDTTVAATVQTGAAYTFALADAGTVVEGNSASAQTFTVPPNSSVAFTLGTIIEVFQYGAGQITIAAGVGVTLRSYNTLVHTAGAYATVTLRQRATNEWVLAGELA